MNSIRSEKKWKTKLSSAGLIYCHFGEDVIKLMMKKADEKILNVIYDMVQYQYGFNYVIVLILYFYGK